MNTFLVIIVTISVFIANLTENSDFITTVNKEHSHSQIYRGLEFILNTSNSPPTLGELFPEEFEKFGIPKKDKVKKNRRKQTQTLPGLLTELEKDNQNQQPEPEEQNVNDSNSMNQMIAKVAQTTIIEKPINKNKKSKKSDFFILTEKEELFAHSLFYKSFQELEEYKNQFAEDYSKIKTMTSDLRRRKEILLAVEDWKIHHEPRPGETMEDLSKRNEEEKLMQWLKRQRRFKFRTLDDLEKKPALGKGKFWLGAYKELNLIFVVKEK